MNTYVFPVIIHWIPSFVCLCANLQSETQRVNGGNHTHGMGSHNIHRGNTTGKWTYIYTIHNVLIENIRVRKLYKSLLILLCSWHGMVKTRKMHYWLQNFNSSCMQTHSSGQSRSVEFSGPEYLCLFKLSFIDLFIIRGSNLRGWKHNGSTCALYSTVVRTLFAFSP